MIRALLILLSTVAVLSEASQKFPRNLHRLYDGTWENGKPPFPVLPPPPDARLAPNHTARPAAEGSTEFSFLQRSGFALLTPENHPSDLGPAINIVFGELILRDGQYRSPRDVTFRIVGVYEWASGTIVVVGDALFEDVSSALQRLYQSFEKARPGVSKHLNITEEGFVAALTPPSSEHGKQLRKQRPGTKQASIPSQCPFSATFHVVPGEYNDRVPRKSDLSGLQSFGGVGVDSPQMASTTVDEQVGSEQGGGQDELVEMKGTFVSDACNTEMTLVLSTLDTEALFGKAINYTLLVTVVAFAQVIVLIRQMEMTSTQAGARRVSLMTVGLQAVADSYLCLGHLTMGIAVQSLFNAFATAAFFKFICFSIFLMRWMLLIWKARRPSGFSEGWEAMRRELSMLYSRFYGSLLLGIFLLYQLQGHLRFFLFALYSFWVPQIVLNVVEDHRRPLLPLYILGTSITRLAIPLYFWGCPYNFLHIHPEPGSAVALVAWLLTQAAILLSQYKFGPRWFIPKEFLPEKYDYYRTVTFEEEEEEKGEVDIEAQIGMENRPLMQPPATAECCICMESVAIHSRERMVTPCNHFFHATCLERWLEVRLECALCRSPVPPP